MTKVSSSSAPRPTAVSAWVAAAWIDVVGERTTTHVRFGAGSYAQSGAVLAVEIRRDRRDCTRAAPGLSAALSIETGFD